MAEIINTTLSMLHKYPIKTECYLLQACKSFILILDTTISSVNSLPRESKTDSPNSHLFFYKVVVYTP